MSTSTNNNKNGKNAQRKKQLRRAKEKEAMGLVVEEALPINSFSQEDLLTTARTLTQLAALDYETLHTKRFKEIRRAVFSFASTAGESFDGKGKKPQWVAKISDALRDQNWNHALELMSAARIGIIPKLGTLQRWVRDADLASSDKRNVIDSNTITSTNWVVLDAILRTSQQPIFKTGDNLKYSLSDGNTLRRFESWDPFDGKEFDSSYTTSPPDNLKYSIVTTEKRWKGVRDLSIFTTDNIIVSGDSPRGKKTPLPFIDGGFVMENIFSKEECNAIIGTAESMEFVPDAEYTMSTSDDSGPGKAAAGVVWLANDQMLNTIFNRVKHHLPQTLGGGQLGIDSEDSISTPLKCVDWPEDIVDIKCGSQHTLVLTSNQQVYTCGCGLQGELGKFPSKDSRMFSQNHDLLEIIRIECGSYHSICIDVYDNVFVFGCNNEGQLGLGDFSDRYSGNILEVPSDSSSIDISSGGSHTFVKTSANEIFGFGNNRNSQILENEESSSPVRVFEGMENIWKSKKSTSKSARK